MLKNVTDDEIFEVRRDKFKYHSHHEKKSTISLLFYFYQKLPIELRICQKQFIYLTQNKIKSMYASPFVRSHDIYCCGCNINF